MQLHCQFCQRKGVKIYLAVNQHGEPVQYCNECRDIALHFNPEEGKP